MELISFNIPKDTDELVIASIGDIQYTTRKGWGSTAKDHLKRHLDRCQKLNAYYVGTGDYTDPLSPSNRKALQSAQLYDTAKDAIAERFYELTEELYEDFLKPTTGRWLGLCEGHHFYQAEGRTTDEMLAELLKTTFLGTSAFIRIPRADITLYVHHGTGGRKLPGSTLNRTYHLAAGLQGADIYLLGHDTKLGVARLSRPYPVWGKKQSEHHLQHRDIWLVSTGSFSKSNIVGHRDGAVKRGDYAEQRLLTPSPLSAPIITVDLTTDHDRIRVSI